MNLADLAHKKVHFIGMGGAGMSGIARIMLAKGISVSGSDAKDSQVLAGLRALGAHAFVGHSAANVAGVDVVIISSAIAATNPELLEARNQGLTVIARAEALALLMSESRSIAVAGTHGKTTTTSMLTVALQRAGLDPSFAIGGMINSAGTNAHSGTGDIFVAEADESDGSFLAYKPLGAIITNIELDHVDHFPDIQAVNRIFVEFISSIQAGGFLVACIDSPGVRELLAAHPRKDISVITYGTDPQADFAISHISLTAGESRARITHLGRTVGELHLTIPGEHNIFNAVAALAVGITLGAPAPALLDGLASFSGARRRFELKGTVGGIRVIDDYGHHPTEVTVTLETARRYAGNGNVIAIFQPHRYSRTQAFAQEFAIALDLADQVYLLEIYPASEAPIPGVSSLMVTKAMNPAKAHFEPSMIEVVSRVLNQVKSGDLILTLGAGDVNSLAPVILEALEERVR
jgi:UDP-N-acetylmuramate--alanine ligase